MTQEGLILQSVEPQHAIQEHNLKAALGAASIVVETVDADGVEAVEEVEREVLCCSVSSVGCSTGCIYLP